MRTVAQIVLALKFSCIVPLLAAIQMNRTKRRVGLRMETCRMNGLETGQRVATATSTSSNLHCDHGSFDQLAQMRRCNGRPHRILRLPEDDSRPPCYFQADGPPLPSSVASTPDKMTNVNSLDAFERCNGFSIYADNLLWLACHNGLEICIQRQEIRPFINDIKPRPNYAKQDVNRQPKKSSEQADWPTRRFRGVLAFIHKGSHRNF